MCGIAGILRFDATAPVPDVLRTMAARLAHRGPDGHGLYAPAGEPIGLSHARLRVIDLATGDQPMFGPDGRHVIVYNGEIYNFAELRAQLIDRGHSFRTHSDTETILNAYAEWGEACVEHLDGMFAFALWDTRARRLLLARDRAGKKPLFVYQDGRQLVFGSELKAVLAVPDVDSTLDPAALPQYLTYGYVPTPATFYQRIRKLAPGTTLSARPDADVTARTYWQVSFGEPAATQTLPAAQTTLRSHLEAAVRRRMVADVPVGAFLSGGIDSSIIVGLMSRISERPVKTFSIGFSGDDVYDETRYARTVARHFGTDHTEFMVEADSFDMLDELVAAYDEPFGDSSAIPTSVVARLSRQSVTVALSGDGGDELFAGYLRLHAAAAAERIPTTVRAAGRRVAALLPAGGSHRSLRARTTRFLNVAAEPLTERYLRWIGIFPENVAGLLRPELRHELMAGNDTRASFNEVLNNCHDRSTLAQLLTLNFRTYLLDDLLVKMDRCSMMHSLEVRSPFLDTQLIEFAARLPDSYLFRRGVTKYILRGAFRDMLPAEILKRGKMGFGIPLDRWFRTRWRSMLTERLGSDSAPIRAWLDKDALASVVNAHLANRANHGHKLWSLLTLDAWLAHAAGARI